MSENRRGLPLRNARDTDGDTRRVLEKLEESGSVNDLVRLLANSPNGFRPFVLMSNALLTGAALPADVREVVILALAARHRAGFQWREHVAMGQRAGVTQDQIAALRDGRESDPALFSPGQRLALRLCSEIAEGRRLTLEHWDAMAREWSIAAALDLVLTIGWWGGFVPLVLGALEAHGLANESPT